MTTLTQPGLYQKFGSKLGAIVQLLKEIKLKDTKVALVEFTNGAGVNPIPPPLRELHLFGTMKWGYVNFGKWGVLF